MNKIITLCTALILCLASTIQIQAQDIQRVRLDFETPQGFLRQLLLGFTPDNAATDGFDYGYDGATPQIIPDDLNWIIEDGRYVIQGVGAFDETKKYPLGLFLTNAGDITISLNSLENFDEAIDVYIYDAQNDTYFNINTGDFTSNIAAGDYWDRFYIAFVDENQAGGSQSTGETLSIGDSILDQIQVKYLRNSHEILIDTNNQLYIKNLKIYNIFGQKLLQIDHVTEQRVKVPLTPNTSNNILLVRLKTTKGNILKKIVI